MKNTNNEGLYKALQDNYQPTYNNLTLNMLKNAVNDFYYNKVTEAGRPYNRRYICSTFTKS